MVDPSAWLPWQREYVHGVLLIVPPDPPLAEVNALRARYAWSQSSECDAHISLTVPLPHALSTAEWQELAAIAAAWPPFTIRYGPLRHYLPHPGVCLAVEPQEQLDGLRQALEAASCFADSPPRRWPFSAHLTIAELISVEQTEAILAELAPGPAGEFVCDQVVHLVPDAAFRFRAVGRLRLGA